MTGSFLRLEIKWVSRLQYPEARVVKPSENPHKAPTNNLPKAKREDFLDTDKLGKIVKEFGLKMHLEVQEQTGGEVVYTSAARGAPGIKTFERKVRTFCTILESDKENNPEQDFTKLKEEILKLPMVHSVSVGTVKNWVPSLTSKFEW